MIVVDTNILIYRFLAPSRDEAVDALARLDVQWAAPLLWRSEFRNVLGGYVRAGRLSLGEAEAAVAHAASRLLGGEHWVSDHVVLDLVARSRCTAYDCEFAGLAVTLRTVLATEDKALLHAFPRFCRSLTDIVEKGLGSTHEN